MNKSAEKGLVPELRFPEFKGQWRSKKLGELCISISSGKDKAAENGAYDLYGSTGIIGRTLNDTFNDELILAARVGANAGLLTKASGKYGVTDNTLVITLEKTESIDFIYYTLDNFGLNQMVFGSGQTLITGKQLKELDIDLPCPREQQKIADCLSSLDELVSAHNQKLDALKAHKKGLMQQLFPAEGETVPKLRFPEFGEKWTKSTIGMLIQNELIFPPKDGNHGNIHPKSSDYVKYGIPFIMANDIKNGEIDLLKCSHLSKEQADNLQKGFAKEGDVLLTHKGTVGSVTTVKENEFPYLMLTPQVTYYRVKDKEKLLNKFLAYSFISELFQGELKNASGGGTRAYIGITAQKNLNVAIAPTFDEQQKIADCLSRLDELIAAQSQKIEALKTHKKGLMQQLFPSAENGHMDAKAKVGA
ncbi:restriction endonuclease subunit S [Pseudoalteromonas sp. SR45-5]|uniref:restriction endonuclease subunit S n=1 Tax=Pseudoalteromonas sp. SR45-5 TaxID=2760928 RepID=UPI0015FA5F05|nr:restriction endonuclease subunit S [Pseudoalteromonas sp. SR45-5]MBB1353602.1 restriction endonuclease subunit S [Pseudoalteromonas sp. SR45-5]